MESELISKNEACPKSLLSRKNVLKHTKIGIKQCFLLLLIFTCLSITNISAQNVDVYAAGTVNGQLVDVWKNGDVVYNTQGDISRYYYVIENGIYVNGNDVYVIGYSYPQSGFMFSRYTLWKNGIATDFPLSTEILSICGSGNDIYMAGAMDIGASYQAAVVWKNGEPTYLTDGTIDAYATCVSVVGNDVYVAGNRNYNCIYVWKNNELISTIDTPGQAAHALMYIDGSDIYVTNGISSWKNGTKTVFNTSEIGTTSYYVYSIFVNNGNVYVVGLRYGNGNQDGLFWTNGNLQITPNASFYSVFVYNDNIYIAGMAGTGTLGSMKPIICKNGVITPLSSSSGQAKAVFVSSSTTAINKIANTNTHIYLNPIGNSFIVDYVGFIQVNIYDMLGKEVLTQNVNGKTEIDINHLLKGIYIISITSEGKIIGKCKIMKQ